MQYTPRPFHEILPDLIRDVSAENLIFLSGVIKKVEIPSRQHSLIEEAWISKCRELQMGLTLGEYRTTHKVGFPGYVGPSEKMDEDPYFGVPEALGEQARVREFKDRMLSRGIQGD